MPSPIIHISLSYMSPNTLLKNPKCWAHTTNMIRLLCMPPIISITYPFPPVLAIMEIGMWGLLHTTWDPLYPMETPTLLMEDLNLTIKTQVLLHQLYHLS